MYLIQNWLPRWSCLNLQLKGTVIGNKERQFFAHCRLNPNPLVQQIGIYTLADLTNLYKKCKPKRTKHILL